MSISAAALFVIIAVIDLVHYAVLFIFLRGIHRKEWTKPEKLFTPKTAVCLALRGADPFLKRCITGLLTQDYPNYSVRLIVDSQEDSALPIVQRILEEIPHRCACSVDIMTVTEHNETCTLKCNSLLHALETLDPSFEVFAVCDADTLVHPSWLRDLVEPLSDPGIAAATGYRWYVPEKPNTGSLVRYLWNAAAVVQIYLYRIAWGGSMALRRDLFGNVAKSWRTAFTDDASLAPALKAAGCKLVFVPPLFMVNRETVTLSAFHRWVKRQLLCAKLHHPSWNNVAAQGILITLPLLAAVGLFVAGMCYGDWRTAVWSAAAVALYWGGVYGTLPIMEGAIRKMLRERGERAERWSWKRMLLTLAVIPVTQLVYTSALLRLYFVRRVEWRGAEYEIAGKNVRLITYQPYTQKQKESESIL
ncbi:MAG: glycosyltransferase family 2 protein [Planctomycetaceae bacterium]|jgi:glycosyltransferase involved in cell wall biosynthesis|nr:glycosyltransferase family 2 protein [Planctomycetaceae bacterium]